MFFKIVRLQSCFGSMKVDFVNNMVDFIKSHYRSFDGNEESKFDGDHE